MNRVKELKSPVPLTPQLSRTRSPSLSTPISFLSEADQRSSHLLSAHESGLNYFNPEAITFPSNAHDDFDSELDAIQFVNGSELYHKISSMSPQYFKYILLKLSDRSLFKYIDPETGNSFLHYSLICGKIELLKAFLEYRDNDIYQTPLFGVSFLLKKNLKGDSVLSLALNSLDFELVRILLTRMEVDFYPDMSDEEVLLPLFALICSIIENTEGYVRQKCAHYLNEFIADYYDGLIVGGLSLEEYLKVVSLAFALEYKFEKVAKFLMENEQTLLLNYPYSMYCAIKHHNVQAVSVLLSHKELDFNMKDTMGYAFIHIAVFEFLNAEWDEFKNFDSSKEVLNQFLFHPSVNPFELMENKELNCQSILSFSKTSELLNQLFDTFFEENYKINSKYLLKKLNIRSEEIHESLILKEEGSRNEIEISFENCFPSFYPFFEKFGISKMKIIYATGMTEHFDNLSSLLEEDMPFMVLMRIQENTLYIDLYEYHSFLKELKSNPEPKCKAGQIISTLFRENDPHFFKKTYLLHSSLI